MYALYLSECPVISNKELESIAAVVEDREESHPRLKRRRIAFEYYTVILSLIYAKSH